MVILYWNNIPTSSVCVIGYEGPPGNCTECPLGKFRDALNLTSCQDCPTGKSTAETGANSSALCGEFLKKTGVQI